jgi:hypothetical protein
MFSGRPVLLACNADQGEAIRCDGTTAMVEDQNIFYRATLN